MFALYCGVVLAVLRQWFIGDCGVLDAYYLRCEGKSVYLSWFKAVNARLAHCLPLRAGRREKSRCQQRRRKRNLKLKRRKLRDPYFKL